VTCINKQRFLAELGKLLTFMYEEDRLRALEMYTRMFEEAGDESALIQSLASPTKQAVVVARAYNSNLGKLSVTAEKKAAPEDMDQNGVPDYVQAIEAVREAAFALQPAPEEDSPAPVEESVSEEPKSAAEEEGASDEAESAETEENAPDEPESAEMEESVSDEAESAEPEENASDEAESAEAEESASDEAESAEAEESAPAEEESLELKETAHDEDAGAETETRAVAENTTQENIQFFSMPEEGGGNAPEPQPEESVFNIDTDLMRKPRRKAKVFALIVFILFAIPITLAAIAILLVPAVLFLALAVAAILCGVVLVSAAFHGFAVFADIMVVLGVALVLFALGLLFLWTAIWFVGGAIVGVVHGVAALCDKWCYKEVLD